MAPEFLIDEKDLEIFKALVESSEKIEKSKNKNFKNFISRWYLL